MDNESGVGDECDREADHVAEVDQAIQEEKLERSRRNRERALKLRRSRIATAHPYNRPQNSDKVGAHVTKPKTASYRDSHAGFIIEDEPVGQSKGYRMVEEDGIFIFFGSK